MVDTINSVTEGLESPILSDLSSMMNVEIAVNADGQAFVFHNKPLPCILQWAELDVDLGSLVLLTEEGRLLNIGMKVQPALMEDLIKAAKIQIVQMRDRKVWDIYELPLLISGETMN